MNDIKNILYSSIDAKGEEFSYNLFCECIEKSFKNCCSLINVNKTDVNDIDIFDLTLYFFCKAIICNDNDRSDFFSCKLS